MSQCHITEAEKYPLLLRLVRFKANVISQVQLISLIIETIVKTVYLSLKSIVYDLWDGYDFSCRNLHL